MYGDKPGRQTVPKVYVKLHHNLHEIPRFVKARF